MSCPTCDLPMCVLVMEPKLYWCPSCGTVKGFGGRADNIDTPMLVTKCREFQTDIYDQSLHAWNAWLRLGIAESIHKPEDRPT